MAAKPDKGGGIQVADDRFRRQLSQVLDQWVSDGLIAPAQKDRIRDYYKLDDLPRVAGDRFTFVVLLLGALLVGLGLITFIAANWIWIPRPLRALGALGIMAGCQWVGFQRWRTGSRRLGTLLLLMGEMAIGASIGLAAQWFQVSGSPAGLFWAWGLGVLAVAWCIRHTPSGILALFLLLVGGVIDFDRGSIWAFDPAVSPWLVAATMMPLAYWCRSRWLMAQSILLLGMALLGLGSELGSWSWSGSSAGEIPTLFSISLAHLVGIWGVWSLGLWHQDGLVWLRLRLAINPDPDPDLARDQDTGLDLAPTAQVLGLWGMLGILYIWSFSGVWEDVFFEYGGLGSLLGRLTQSAAGWSLLGLILGVGILWGWRLRRDWPAIQQDWAGPVGMAHAVGILPLLLMGMWALGGIAVLSALWILLVNGLLLALGMLLVWQGLQWAQRWRFWLGLLTMTGLVLTRFFEFPGDLLLKSLVLVLSGVAVIGAGLRFEKTIMARPRPH